MTNHLLRNARERQGWTQAQVAERIDASPVSVHRWERGLTFPSHYYRQKLCDLFEASAESLGLIPPDSSSVTNQDIPVAERESQHRIDESPGELPPVPAVTAPGHAHNLIGRDRLLKTLKDQLTSVERPSQFALHGLPGVGKTALALALMHDSGIHAHFADGILWAGAGPRPELVVLLGAWARTLGVALTTLATLREIDVLGQALQAIIGGRRMLLIIDDIWSAKEALALRVGGPECSYLFTTRFPLFAAQIAPHSMIAVPELEIDDSLSLLNHLAPAAVSLEPEQAQHLVQAIGGLPLSLVLMGRYLYQESITEQPRRIRAALTRLQRQEELLRLVFPRAMIDEGAGFGEEDVLSLYATIALSVEDLTPPACSLLMALATFDPKPNTISEETIAALCTLGSEAAFAALDALCDAGLLESSSPGRYMMHQTIAAYARSQPAEIDKVLGERLIIFFTRFVQREEKNYTALEQDLRNILTALRLASEQQRYDLLAQPMHALAPFLLNRGLYELAERYLLEIRQASTPDQEYGRDLTALYLGRIYELRGAYEQASRFYEEGLAHARARNQGKTICRVLGYWGEMLVNWDHYEQAEQALREGLRLAQDLNLQTQMAVLLKNLGETMENLDRIEEARDFYTQGLLSARTQEDWETMSVLLQDLGTWEARHGSCAQAVLHYKEGLEHASKIGHLQRMSALLLNLGMEAFKRQEYDEAETLYMQSLKLAGRLQNPVRLCCVLQNLGMLARVREHYDTAEIYLREALQWAQSMNMIWYISETRCEWGELYLQQQHLVEAEHAFEQALHEARQINNSELIGISTFGLARVYWQQREHTLAQRFAQESLSVFRTIKQAQAAQVERWLAALPADA